jgi:predicted transcriptional regulator
MIGAGKVLRRTVRREGAIFVGARVSKFVVEAVDRVAGEVNCDRSKFLRRALEEKIARRKKRAVR